MDQLLMTYRKLVMPGDENPAKSLFGGRLMQWADEAAALFAMCQMRTSSIVTLKISEVLFKNPSQSGDILEFWTRVTKIGRTSMTVDCIVTRKIIGEALDKPVLPQFDKGKYVGNPKNLILSCEFVFVAVDKNRRPIPHSVASKNKKKLLPQNR